MEIGFFFQFEKLMLQLPINPEKVTVKYAGNNKKMEIIQLGEINLLKDRKLATLSFSSILPQNPWFSAVRTSGEFKTPKFYKDFFTSIQDKKKPVRIIITGLNINMKASIESFEFFHQAGDHEDAYFSIDLCEYRDYSIMRMDPPVPIGQPATATVRAATTTAIAPTSITIGCSVILNGRVHLDSYGSSPGKTFTNYTGKINLINKKGSHPYHFTTTAGAWLGWVTKESVVLV